jgi:hypothetical protein
MIQRGERGMKSKSKGEEDLVKINRGGGEGVKGRNRRGRGLNKDKERGGEEGGEGEVSPPCLEPLMLPCLLVSCQVNQSVSN